MKLQILQDRILDQVVKLVNSHFRNVRYTKTELKKTLDAEGRVFYTLVDNKVVSYLILALKDGVWRIEYVGVQRDWRGKKLGSSLIKKAKAYVEKRGGFIFCYISIYNTPSINMFIKAGFLVEFINTRWVHLRYDY